MKKIIVASLFAPLLALAQSYPSPTYQNLTVLGTFTGSISAASLAAQAANTVVANVTASSHTPSAVALPSCSTSTSALQYTSGTGFSCGSSFASLTGATFTGNLTVNASSASLIMNDTSGSGFPEFVYQSQGVNKWIVFDQPSSHLFSVNRYVSGSFVDAPLTISNANGQVTMGDGIVSSPISGSTGSFTTLAASGAVSGAGFTSLLSPYALLSGATFTGAVSINSGTTTGSVLNLYGSGVAQAVQFYINTSGPNTYGLYNGSTGHSGFQVNMATDVATFFARPVFGSATPWDSANLNFATPPAIGGTTPAAGAFTTLSASSTVSGTGFSTYLASPPAIGGTAAAAGSFTTLSATGNFTPSQTNGIVGTTTNNNANAGSVGETITATASSVAQTSATLTNVTSVSLTAGDWDVTCSWNGTAATQTSAVNFGLTTTSGAQAPAGQRVLLGGLTSATGTELACPTFRLSLSSTTTLYLTSAPTFTGSMTVGGTIWARRRR